MTKFVTGQNAAGKMELIQKLEADFAAAAAMPRRYAAHPCYDAADIRAVYTKLHAHLERTGAPIFYQLLQAFSVHLKTLEDDGISADLVQAAAMGRIEAEAYFSHLCRLLPPSLFVAEYWDELEKIRHSFQYSYIQTALDSWMRTGATGNPWKPSPDAPKVSAHTIFWKRYDSAYDTMVLACRTGGATLQRARKAYQKLETEVLCWERCSTYRAHLPLALTLCARASDPVSVKLFLFRLEGFSWDCIAEKIGLSVKICQNRYYRYIDMLKKALTHELPDLAKKGAHTFIGEKILLDLEEEYQIF